MLLYDVSVAQQADQHHWRREDDMFRHTVLLFFSYFSALVTDLSFLDRIKTTRDSLHPETNTSESEVSFRGTQLSSACGGTGTNQP